MEKQFYITNIDQNFEKTTQFSQIKLTQYNSTCNQHQQIALFSKITKQKKNQNFLKKKELKRMIGDQIHESYYQNKSCKPFIHLIKIITSYELQKKSTKKQQKQLQIRIPQTLIFLNGNYHMLYHEQGKIKLKQQVTYESFYNRISLINQGYPLIVSCTANQMQISYHLLAEEQENASKVMPKNENEIMRRYIQPYAKFANVLRLYYRSNGKTYAYKLKNKQSIKSNNQRKKINEKYLVNIKKTDNYEINTVIHGKKECEDMCESLIHYLQIICSSHINEIVVDFIIDNNHKAWLWEVVSIRSKKMKQLRNYGTPEQIILLSRKQINVMKCALCGNGQFNLQHSLTNKMISKLIMHMKDRNFMTNYGKYFLTLNKVYLQKNSKICQLCYNLLKAEDKLVKVQKQLSIILNSPYQEYIVPLLLCQNIKLYQWRILIYFQDLHILTESQQDFTIKMAVKIKKTDYKFNKIQKKSYKLDNRTINYEQVHKFHKSIETISTQTQSNNDKTMMKNALDSEFSFQNHDQSQYKNNSQFKSFHSFHHGLQSIVKKKNYCRQANHHIIPIHQVKVLTLYTESQNHISPLLDQMQITFKINQKQYIGKTSTLTMFGNDKKCQRSSNQVYLFDQNLKYCTLQLNVGLEFIGLVEKKKDILKQLQDGLYIQKSHENCLSALPEEWMELFKNQQECMIVENIF